MSLATPMARQSTSGTPIPHPYFIGLVRSELFKLSRQRTTWITSGIVVLFIAFGWLQIPGSSQIVDYAKSDPLKFHLLWMETSLSVIRIFSGFALVIITARIFGLDYQQGTIRVILSRGVERLVLMGAKLVTALLVALGILVGSLIVNTILALIVIPAVGGANTFSVINGTFWSDSWLYLLSVVISMVATVLLTMALTVIGRSLTFGLALGLVFFAADNTMDFILSRVAETTGNDFYNQVTTFMLGPSLNFLGAILLPHPLVTMLTREGATVNAPDYAFQIGFPPTVIYDATHFLAVIVGWGIACIGIATYLTWRRDVLE